MADITQPCRAQNRVRNGMQQDIRIGMAIRTDVRGDSHPSQDAGATGHQRVFQDFFTAIESGGNYGILGNEVTVEQYFYGPSDLLPICGTGGGKG